MKRYSYSERDYAFGQMMLTLQTHIGLTQAGLAERLGVSRRAVAEWEARSGERLYTLSEPNAVVHALAWNPSGTLLLSGSSDGMLRWWDLQRGECVRVRKAHQGPVQSLKLSPDGRLLASCGDDGAINVWELESGEHLRTLRRDRPYERMDISGVKGLTEAQKASLRALGAIEEKEGFLKD
jgi:WD40 repeat protein